MAAGRVFFVTQDDLLVYYVGRGGVTVGERFDNSESGAVEFGDYLRQSPVCQSRILVDVIEEEFTVDAVAQLPRRDRTALLQRRLARRYSRTPYRLVHQHGSSSTPSGEQRVTYCAISNDELLNPWVEQIVSAHVPLESITSVPLLARAVLKGLKKPKGNTLLLSVHQRNKLRLVFMSEGHILSARLSHSLPIDDSGFPASVAGEIQKSRRYLERARHMRAEDEIDVYLILDAEDVERVARAAGDSKSAMRLHTVSPADIAKSMRLTQTPPSDRLEMLYVEAASRFGKASNYAARDLTRWHRLYAYRSMAAAALIAVSLGAAWLTGENLVESIELRSSYTTMLQQTRQMEETFRREHQAFGESQAESHEMKSAVDAGDFILANRVPIDVVMSHLAAVFDKFPTVRVDQIAWNVDGTNLSSSVRAADEPQPLLPTSSLSAQIVGQIVPFEGDLREAFTTIENLREALSARPTLTDVAAVEYPIDARPDATVSGELVGAGTLRAAPFRLSLRIVQAGEIADDDSA